VVEASSRTGAPGFALLLVVIALALLGVLSLSSFGIARREYRIAIDLGFALQALESAESGLSAVESMAATGGGAPILAPQAGPSADTPRTRYRTSMLRLNSSLFMLTAVGERFDPEGGILARRELGVLGKIVPPADSTPARFERLEAWGWVQLYD